MSGVPEITEAEATTKNPSALENLSKTTTINDGQTSHQGETLKQDLTNTVSSTPKQDSTNSNPQNEPPTNGNPQNDIPEQIAANTDRNSKTDSSCLPLPGLFTPKGAKSPFKNPAGVPENAYSKDELARSIDAEIKGVPENAYSKDELARSIDAEIKYIKDEAKRLKNYTSQIDGELDEALERLQHLKEDEDEDFSSLRDLQKAITKLKLQIPKQKADIDDTDPHKDHQAGTLKLKQRDIPDKVMKQMPRLYHDDLFLNSPEFRDLEARFNQLPVELKLCLLCFSIFPGNEDIKKRLLVYWWMTEGYVPPRDEESRIQIKNGNKTAEEFADEFFEKFTKMGFIEPVNKNRSLSVGSYRMHPFVSTALVILAEKAKFFDFENGEPTQNFSETLQACLVGKGLIDYQDLREGKVKVQDLEKLHTVINVSEHILEFKKEWLLKMKNVNVLYLGRWKASATHHIEVEDVEEKDFLEGLQDMNLLKFFSLQGVSRIMELPESISKLLSLMILDLRACHSLESIPEKIGLLKNLTHLDISECYLIERMPKSIASLSELRILKGFVVSENDRYSCNLKDLATLRKLIKLSIYTGLMEFPDQNDIEALQEFKVLRKLTIAWGGDALKASSSISTSGDTKQPEEGERKKENTQEKRGGIASQSKPIEVPEPPKVDGIERKENTREIQGDASKESKPQSSKTAESLKPDEGEREEKKIEKQGGSASLAQSSKTSEPSQAEGERQKETSKEIQEDGDLKTQSTRSTTEAPKPHDGVEKQKMTTKEIQEEDVLQAPSSKSTSEAASKTDSGGEKTQTSNREIKGRVSPSSKSTEAPKPHDGVEKQKMTTKEIQEEDVLQAPSSKSTSDAASKTDSGGEKTQTTNTEIKGSVSPSSKSTAEAPKKDDREKIKVEKTPLKAAFDRTKTFGRSPPPPPPPALKRLEQLEKLDLKSFPKAKTPDWLMPSTLKSLKKLYIRGGKFSDLGQYQDLGWWTGGQKKHTWKVKILRLKYLSELEMDWRELQELFPDLVYLEKVSCPKLSLFPCDVYGVWINQIKLKQMQEKP